MSVIDRPASEEPDRHIVPAFETLKGRADALYVCVDPVLNAHRISINTLANVARLREQH
jgi:putative tryptophan/tyrosine transport system substrate-binding protein